MKTTLDTTTPGILRINGKVYRGKIFHVEGQEIELYQMQALAYALNRGQRTIRAWEQARYLPKPLFKITGGKPGQEDRRWYSRTQIINLYQAYNRFPFSQGRPDLREPFFALVHQVFDEGEIIDVGNIPVRTGRTAHTVAAAPGGTVSIGSQSRTDSGSGSRKSTVVAPATRYPARATEPGASRTVAPPPSYRDGDVAFQPESRGHRPQPTGAELADGTRHTTSPAPHVTGQGADYRRRPKGSL